MDTTGEGRGLLTIRLDEARFGLWVDEVLEVVRTPPITKLPLTSDEVPGVTSVRGDVVPVLDLGRRVQGVPARRPGRLVLVHHHDSDSVVGLLVDAVETLVPVEPADIGPPPKAAEATLPAEFVTGVVSRAEGVVTILHLGRVAAPPDASTEEG